MLGRAATAEVRSKDKKSYPVGRSLVTEHFLHTGINKLGNFGVGSERETSDGSKHHYQAMFGTG